MAKKKSAPKKKPAKKSAAKRVNMKLYTREGIAWLIHTYTIEDVVSMTPKKLPGGSREITFKLLNNKKVVVYFININGGYSPSKLVKSQHKESKMILKPGKYKVKVFVSRLQFVRYSKTDQFLKFEPINS